MDLPTGPLKTRSGLVLVPGSEPSTYQSIGRRFSHCATGTGFGISIYYNDKRAAYTALRKEGMKCFS